MIRIIWSPKYLQYNFGPGHPFWAERGQVFLNLLEETSLEYEIVRPKPTTDKDILLVHTPGYLKGVNGLYQSGRPLSLDTPLTPGVLEAAYYSVGGTMLTCELALQKKRAINLLGGLHHAETDRGGGFCIWSDHSIAIRKLQKQGKIRKAMIYDLDVHTGNGTQEIFYDDPSVFNISLHQDPLTIYPGTGFADQTGAGAGKGFNLNIPLPPGTTGKEYLKELDKVLPLYEEFQPDLVILILGVDTYEKDKLGNLKLKEKDFFEIGQRFKRFPKLAILCAGGYSPQVPKLWLEFLEGFL